jgi:hypothetical protein
MESVVRVIPQDNYVLELWFDTGEHKVFDVKPYLNRGVFARLQDIDLFKQAYVSLDTVCWPGELDIAPETLYDCSKPVACQDSPLNTCVENG